MHEETEVNQTVCPTCHQQVMPSHILRSRAASMSITALAFWRSQLISSPFSQLLLLSKYMVQNMPLVRLVSSPGCIPSQELAQPQCAGEGGSVGEAAFMLYQQYSAGARALMCYQHLPNYHYKAQHCEGCCEEN